MSFCSGFTVFYETGFPQTAYLEIDHSSQEEKKNRVIKHLATLQIIRKKMIKVMEK
jgi:hypothetical protein